MMESQSDLSSISSQLQSQQLQQHNKVPSIHIDEYLLDSHAKNLSSVHQSQHRKGFPRIFTVAQTLKDPLILNHIKPDYGSLGEFIGDINIGQNLLSQKKRKNQGNEDDLEQKRIKASFKEKSQEDLNNVYLSKSASGLQKKIAGKLMVESLFKDSFGMTLTSFENQNAKKEPVKNYKINLAEIDEIFDGKRQTATKMQEQSTEKKSTAFRNSRQEMVSQGERKKQEKSWTERQRMEIILQAKSKYPSLRRLEVKKQCAQYKKLMPKEEQQQNQSHIYRSEQKKQKEKPVHILELTETSFRIEKLTLKPQLMLFIMTQFSVQKLRSLTLNQIRITEELLCFMLDIVKEISHGLTSFSMKCVAFQKADLVATKIKELLENVCLKELTLEYIDFETKQFCLVCLGIGSNTTLEMLSFDNNAVDQRACKSLELISKHCENLKKISLRKNYLQPHHLSYFSAQSKAKIQL